MRARTYIYMLGLAALALQGCNKNTHPSTPDTEPYVISMEPAGVTRALINDIAGLQGEGFVVYGHSLHNSNAQQVFSAQEVKYVDGVWSYSPTRYWDRNATYCFGAYAPKKFTATPNTNKASGIITSVGFTIPQWQKIDGNEVDLVVATSKGAATSYLDTHDGQVNLDFNHLYAQLEVQVVRNAFLKNDYYLNALSYTDVPANENTTYTLDYTTPKATMVADPTSTPMSVYDGAGVLVEPEPKENTTFKYLVLPFTADSDKGFQIAVRYTSGSVTTNVVVNSGFQTLQPNKRYILKLTINSGANIVTSPVQVLDWVEQDTDEEEKYNW